MKGTVVVSIFTSSVSWGLAVHLVNSKYFPFVLGLTIMTTLMSLYILLMDHAMTITKLNIFNKNRETK